MPYQPQADSSDALDGLRSAIRDILRRPRTGPRLGLDRFRGVAPSADIPPRLAREVPDYAGLLPPGERAAAGKQWVIWWRWLVGQAAREARQSVTPLPAGSDPDDFEARIRHRFAAREDVFDPPDFRSLAGMQPLRSAVT